MYGAIFIMATSAAQSACLTGSYSLANGCSEESTTRPMTSAFLLGFVCGAPRVSTCGKRMSRGC